MQFYKLLRLWFCVDFFLNLQFHYNALEFKHRYLHRQRIGIRKIPCFVVYTTALLEEPLLALLRSVYIDTLIMCKVSVFQLPDTVFGVVSDYAISLLVAIQ